jgi:hypothetical protein
MISINLYTEPTYIERKEGCTNLTALSSICSAICTPDCSMPTRLEP